MKLVEVTTENLEKVFVKQLKRITVETEQLILELNQYVYSVKGKTRE